MRKSINPPAKPMVVDGNLVLNHSGVYRITGPMIIFDGCAGAMSRRSVLAH